jgi:hypothetical protein
MALCLSKQKLSLLYFLTARQQLILKTMLETVSPRLYNYNAQRLFRGHYQRANIQKRGTRNFVCLQLISDLLIYEINYWVLKPL